GYDIGDIIGNGGAGEIPFLVIRGRRPSASELKIFNAITAVCTEHGFVNTATVAARYVMSGSTSIPASIAARILAFGQHTGACHLAAEMLLQLTGDGRPEDVTDRAIEEMVVELRKRKLAVQGFGHPIHREKDPRAIALRKLATELGMVNAHFALL